MYDNPRDAEKAVVSRSFGERLKSALVYIVLLVVALGVAGLAWWLLRG
jgi:hypothetical protein